MLIKTDNLKANFHQIILRGRVLLLCSTDMDGLCGSKIIQTILQEECIVYTTVVISSIQQLKLAFLKHSPQNNTVIMLNCGAMNPLQELLDINNNPKLIIFVIDSHRPFDLENIYGSDQIRLVIREGDTIDIPQLEDIFKDEEDDTTAAIGDNSDDDYDDNYADDTHSLIDGSQEETEPKAKRQRVDNALMRKRELRQWRKRRDEILFHYYEYQYYDTAVSIITYDIACKLSKDSSQLLWLAIIGLTNQLLLQCIMNEKYVTDIQQLQHHVARHNRPRELNNSEPSTAQSSDNSDNATNARNSINTLKITFSSELRLCLHRHWTFYDSFYNSEYTSCRFRLWAQKGRNRMLECLADMGVPLIECRQKFSAMDCQYRDDISELFENLAHKYNLPELTYGSFLMTYGFRAKFSAADIAYACSALIESNNNSNNNNNNNTDSNNEDATEVRQQGAPNIDNIDETVDNFLLAQDALSRENVFLLQNGVEKSKLIQVAIRAQVQTFLDRRLVTCLGTFLYACVDSSTVGVHLLGKPMILRRLALFTRHAWSLSSKRARDLPLILSAPSNRVDGYCLLIGLPPHAAEDCKNDMGRAFKYASEKMNANTLFDYIDPSLIEIKLEERSKFLDTLELVLTE